MPSNKPRLYVALHVRSGKPTMPGQEDTYHWALIVAPKHACDRRGGTRYHAKQTMTSAGAAQWVFEARPSSLQATSMVLVKIMVAKVAAPARLAAVLQRVPLRPGVQGWNCVGWVREALALLAREPGALGTHVAEWATVRDAAMAYCQRKKELHRFDGRGGFDATAVPTYDLVANSEVVP